MHQIITGFEGNNDMFLIMSNSCRISIMREPFSILHIIIFKKNKRMSDCLV